MNDLLLLIQQAKTNQKLLPALHEKLNALVKTSDQQAIFFLLQTGDHDAMFYSVIVAEKKFKMELSGVGGILNSPQIDDLLNFIQIALEKAAITRYRLFINKITDLAVLAFLCVYPAKLTDFLDKLEFYLITKPSLIGYILFNRCCTELLNCKYTDFSRKHQLQNMIRSNFNSYIEKITVGFTDNLRSALSVGLVKQIIPEIKTTNSAIESPNFPIYDLNAPSHIDGFTFQQLLSNIVDCLIHSKITTKTPFYRNFVYEFGTYCQDESIYFYSAILSATQDYRIAEEIIQASSRFKPHNIKKIAYFIADTGLSGQLKLYYQSSQILNFVASNMLSDKFERKIDFIERSFKFLRDQKTHFATLEYTSIQIINVIRLLNGMIGAKDFFIKNTIHEFVSNPSSILEFYAKDEDKSFYTDLYDSIQILEIRFVRYIEEMQMFEKEALLNKCLIYLTSFAVINPNLAEILIKKFTSNLPKNSTMVLFKNYQNKSNLMTFTAFQECARLYHIRDSACIDYIQRLDIRDKFDISLCIKIINSFNVPSEILSHLLCIVDPNIADTIFINCIATLQRRQRPDLIPQNAYSITKLFAEGWTLSRKKFLLSLLNQNITEGVQEYFQYFLSLNDKDLNSLLFFDVNSDFKKQDEALDLKILKKIYKINETLPQEVLHRIYSAIPSVSLGALKNIIGNILFVLKEEIANFFVVPVIEKIIGSYADYSKSESIPCIKSMLNFLEKKIIIFGNLIDIDDVSIKSQSEQLEMKTSSSQDSNKTRHIVESIHKDMKLVQDNNDKYGFYIKCLQEMLKIQEKSCTNTIYLFITKHQIPLDFKDVLYKLLIQYNSPQMTGTHGDILNFIIYTLKFPESHEVLLQLPDANVDKINSLLQTMTGSQENKREILRGFLSTVEGKHITELSNNFKASKIILKRYNTQ